MRIYSIVCSFTRVIFCLSCIVLCFAGDSKPVSADIDEDDDEVPDLVGNFDEASKEEVN